MSDEFPEPIIERPDETPNVTEPVVDQAEVKKKKKKEFWLGVGLCFLLNVAVMPIIGGGLFGALSAIANVIGYDSPLQSVISVIYTILNFVPFVVNIGLMIYFVMKKRPQVALGILAGFGIALAIVVCLGVALMAACFASGSSL